MGSKDVFIFLLHRANHQGMAMNHAGSPLLKFKTAAEEASTAILIFPFRAGAAKALMFPPFSKIRRWSGPETKGWTLTRLLLA
jgi:hypothetical protein